MEAPIPAELSIVGFGPSNKPRPSWSRELWSINNIHAIEGFKPDRIVAADDLRRDLVEHESYVSDIVNASCPVYTCTAYPEYPTTVAFPLDDMIDMIGSRHLACKVLTNSCCYALALALVWGHRKIGLYGFDFEGSDNKEDMREARKARKKHEPAWFDYYRRYTVRWPKEPGIHGLCFLIGMAVEMGADLNIPGHSTLMDMDRPPFFYGFQEQPDVVQD